MNINKLLAAIVVSTFAWSAVASYAAQEELTRDQRMDMRSRADQLIADRAANGGRTNAMMEHATRVKKPHAKKAKAASRL